MTALLATWQRFPLGTCLVTPVAREHLAANGVAEGSLLARHATGDWGELDPEDRRENEFSVRRGFRILSSYVVAGEKVWLITEADRSGTTILLAMEY
jgi:hypothetical protein